MRRRTLLCLIGALLLIPTTVYGADTPRRPNVLFIAVDDLRPELNCYGATQIKSPNIDKLASGSVVFTRAYCQQAVCSPSRTSLLTGLRPDTTKIYDLNTHFRKTIPGAVTLPEYFRKNGYHTVGLSKIFHGDLDDPQSWSVPHWRPSSPTYHTPEALETLRKAREEARNRPRANRPGINRARVVERDPVTGVPLRVQRGPRVNGPPWEAPDVPDNSLADGQTADRAIETLREIKDRPFFLAVGFLKPHLPFVAPKKYFDLYTPESIRLASNPNAPRDVPQIALTEWGELRNYAGMPKQGPLTDRQARELVHAYYAAVSFTDAQIGRVIAELERLGLRDNTIVVLWGDHGWHLGEHGLWCKHTNFEIATRVVMMIQAPGETCAPAKTAALSEFVDIYPTLCELAGLPIPSGLEGASLLPVMRNPDRPFKTAAFSQYPRGKVMGHSVRTDRYRYTEWAEPGHQPEAVELYDHLEDPDENVNLAARPENRQLVAELSRTLNSGWQRALSATRPSIPG